jgi:hypothetical protein
MDYISYIKINVIGIKGCTREQVRLALVFRLCRHVGTFGQFNNIIFLNTVEILMQTLEASRDGSLTKTFIKESFSRVIDKNYLP